MRTYFASAVFLAGLGFCLSVAAQQNTSDEWRMYNYDTHGTRFNIGETSLGPSNVSRLHVLWNVTTPAPVTGTPAVVGNDVFAGDWSGNFYQLDQRNGHIGWTAHAAAPISASALVQGDKVIFGDQAGFIYGLDRRSGAMRWQVRPNPHPWAAIFSSPIPVGRYVAIGIASNEEEAALDPGYTCCSFRGSVVLLDPQNGDVVWQTYFISEGEQAAGSSGAAVWSTPTYDDDLDLIYVDTGNNYSAPATGKSDAVIALDANTGSIRWANQRIPNDVSNFTYPIQPDKDSDFGDSPQIYRLFNGQKVVGAGDKNGIYFVFDAATGQEISEKQVQGAGSLGGLFADSAVAYGLVFANGANWPDPFDFSVPPVAGLLTAISGDATRVLWQISVPQKVNLSGVAVANGVVYFAAADPGVGDRLTSSGTLYALNAFTGAVLAAVPFNNCASSGPAVAHGRVFLGLGNEFLFMGNPTGNIVALGL